MNIVSKIKSNIEIYKKEYKQRGIRYLLIARFIKVYMLIYLYNKKIFHKGFTYNNTLLTYCLSDYNYSWLNERTVEIPIFHQIVNEDLQKTILEVGNVYNHYYFFPHDIVDKYEKAENVINKDIIDFKPKKKYDIIFSISTLEHVGWDESKKEKGKTQNAIGKLKSLLHSKGVLYISLPFGYSPDADEVIKNREMYFSNYYFLKRISLANVWKQVHFSEVEHSKYNSPYPNANAIIIGVYKKP